MLDQNEVYLGVVIQGMSAGEYAEEDGHPLVYASLLNHASYSFNAPTPIPKGGTGDHNSQSQQQWAKTSEVQLSPAIQVNSFQLMAMSHVAAVLISLCLCFTCSVHASHGPCCLCQHLSSPTQVISPAIISNSWLNTSAHQFQLV